MFIEEKAKTQSIQREAHTWRVLLSSSDVTESEKASFKTWLEADPAHDLAYDQAVTFYAALSEIDQCDLAPSLVKPTLREKAIVALQKLQSDASSFSQKAAVGGLVAASLVLCFTFLPLEQTNSVATDKVPSIVASSYETNTAETRVITLIDGTRVTLGAASRLEASFSKGRRAVRLVSGAALFDVTPDKDRPFSVEASALTATALGTVFDVRSSGGVVRVSVAEGRVAVEYPLMAGGMPMSMDLRKELGAEQSITAYENSGLEDIQAVDAADIGAWAQGRLVYDLATLSELVADANRYDPRTITIGPEATDLAALKMSGAFSAQTIDTMLLTLQDVLPILLDDSVPGSVTIRNPAFE